LYRRLPPGAATKCLIDVIAYLVGLLSQFRERRVDPSGGLGRRGGGEPKADAEKALPQIGRLD